VWGDGHGLDMPPVRGPPTPVTLLYTWPTTDQENELVTTFTTNKVVYVR